MLSGTFRLRCMRLWKSFNVAQVIKHFNRNENVSSACENKTIFDMQVVADKQLDFDIEENYLFKKLSPNSFDLGKALASSFYFRR